MSIRAVLFDLDGTLVDSTPSVDRCWKNLATAANFDLEKMQSLHGVPARSFITVMLGPERLAEVDHWTEWHLRQECQDVEGTQAFPQVFDLLEWIDQQSHVMWGIVTSCQRELAAARMSAAKIPAPQFIVTADDVTHGKPHPEPYLLGSERAGVAPSECIVVEDAPAGITAGISAGMITLGLTSTHTLEEVAHSSVVVKDIAGVMNFLQQHS